MLKEKLHKLNKNLNIETITNTSNEHIINEIANLDELIAMRFHACLIALKSGVKLLPINYDIKVEELANSFELPILNLDKTETMDEQIKEFKYSIQKYNNNLLDKLTFDFKSIEKII